MIIDSKPGAAEGRRNGKARFKLEYLSNLCKGFETIRKHIIGNEILSKKAQLKLEEFSTTDCLSPEIHYSLKKSNRWKIALSPNLLIENVISQTSDYPVVVVKRQICIGNWKAYCKEFHFQKNPNEKIKSLKIKSGKGASFLSLRGNVIGGVTSKAGEKNIRRRKKGSSLETFENSPSILFIIDEQHPTNYIASRRIGTYKTPKFHRKPLMHKNFALKELDDGCFFDMEEPEVFNVQKPSPSGLTLNDCIIASKLPQSRKRKITESSFEIIEKSDFDKIKNTQKLIFDRNLYQNFTTTKFYVGVPLTFLNSDKEINKFADVHWLNKIQTKCLLIIPKIATATNFNSFIILNQSQKSDEIEIRICSIRELPNIPEPFHLEESANFIKRIIQKVWNFSWQNPSKAKNTPSMVYNFKNDLISTRTLPPCSDFELLFKHQTQFQKFEEIDFVILSLDNNCCNFCGKYESVKLKCGHQFCQKCISIFIISQIEENADVINCKFCETSLDPLIVFYSTPLLLLQKYLRLKYFNNRNNLILCCPNCENILVSKNNVNKCSQNIRCKSCFYVFCSFCKEEPHFPITCAQMKKWKKFQIYRQDWNTTIGFIECFCCKVKIPMTAYTKSFSNIRCEKCCQEVIRQATIKWPFIKTDCLKKEIKLNNRYFPSFITKSISPNFIDAYLKLHDIKYQNGMTQKISLFSGLKANKAREILITILHYIEYGNAWIYFNRKTKIKNISLIKMHLRSLHSLLVQIENERKAATREKSETTMVRKTKKLQILLTRVTIYFS